MKLIENWAQRVKPDDTWIFKESGVRATEFRAFLTKPNDPEMVMASETFIVAFHEDAVDRLGPICSWRVYRDEGLLEIPTLMAVSLGYTTRDEARRNFEKFIAYFNGFKIFGSLMESSSIPRLSYSNFSFRSNYFSITAQSARDIRKVLARLWEDQPKTAVAIIADYEEV